MKKSLNAWSVASETGFAQLFRQVKKAGFDGVELNLDGEGGSCHSLTMQSGPALFQEIRHYSQEEGLPVVSISTSLHAGQLGSPDAAVREKGKDIIKKQLECAAALGADGILVVPGGMSGTVTLREAYENSRQSLWELLTDVKSAGIFVGVENVWNGFFTSPYDMCRFVDDLNCSLVGAYFDVGNVVAFSWPEYWIELLGRRIGKIHVKDFKRSNGLNCGGEFVDLLQGDVNWPMVVSCLDQAGFDQYLTAEVFPGKSYERMEDFYREAAGQLDQIIALSKKGE